LRIIIAIILTCFFTYGCSDNVTSPEVPYSNLLELNGLIDSLGGDCSGVIVRTRQLGIINFNEFSDLKFELNNSSDADMASVQVYYIEADQTNYLLNIEGFKIPETKVVNISSPGLVRELYLRITLKSSVCTGHIYHLSVRDFKLNAK